MDHGERRCRLAAGRTRRARGLRPDRPRRRPHSAPDRAPAPGMLKNTPAALLPAGVALAALGLLAAPWLLRGYGRAARFLLAPARQAEIERMAEARSQAVTAAEAERRRIERDLHDGLQPRLVSLAVDLGIAEARFGKDPDSTRSLLARAHRDAKTAIEELRSLVRGIHPSVLDGRGLDAALSALIASCPVPVSLHADLPQRPDPIREAAAYYVAAEAITNVAKHASARSAAVTVGMQARNLHVVVEDDGSGGARLEPGGGLAGLAARIRSIDGHPAVRMSRTPVFRSRSTASVNGIIL